MNLLNSIISPKIQDGFFERTYFFFATLGQFQSERLTTMLSASTSQAPMKFMTKQNKTSGPIKKLGSKNREQCSPPVSSISKTTSKALL